LIRADAEGGLASTGATLTSDDLAGCGLSGREVREFVAKMSAPEAPDFELELGTMRSAEDMAARLEQAVPGTFE
jgi:hypothetical protein